MRTEQQFKEATATHSLGVLPPLSGFQKGSSGGGGGGISAWLGPGACSSGSAAGGVTVISAIAVWVGLDWVTGLFGER